MAYMRARTSSDTALQQRALEARSVDTAVGSIKVPSGRASEHSHVQQGGMVNKGGASGKAASGGSNAYDTRVRRA